MWGVGLLIFYVANVANVANVSKCILPHFAAHFAVFCGRLSREKAVPLHRISKRAEIAKQVINQKIKTQFLWNL